MRDAIRFAARRFFIGLAVSLLALPAVVVLPDAGAIEGRLFPVVTFYEIANRRNDNGGTGLLITLKKARKCPFVDQQFSAFVRGNWQSLKTFYPNGDDAPLASKFPGFWQIYVITSLPWTEGQAPLRITAHHKCWPFWTTRTVLHWDSET